MFFAIIHLTAIQMAAGDVQMCRGLLWDWRLAGVSAQHAAEPAERFTKVPTHHRWQSEVVGNQPHMMFIVSLFRRLERGAKLALGGGPFTPSDQTQPARVAPFRPH